MKIIRRILLIILILILLVSSLFYLTGKKLYDTKISETDLDTKISQIRSNENFVTLDNVPKYYLNAVVSVEDRRFYNHGAVDFIALARALVSNIRQGEFK